MSLRTNLMSLSAVPVLLFGCGQVPDSSSQQRSPNVNVELPAAATEVQAEAIPTAWFVELELPPLAQGGDAEALKAEKRTFLEAMRGAGIEPKIRYEYSRLWNGFSIQIERTELEKVLVLPGVKNHYPVLTMEADGTKAKASGQTTSDLTTAITQTGVDIVRNLGITGAGIKVGVIDSGIDYDHPALGNGCFKDANNPACRVMYGTDLVGDAYDAANNPITTPDGYPDDCGGHGTHVAGIVGANGDVVGVAPGVTYGAYRVFGCAGSTSTDVMAKAMELAAADGMRVVNMSIGSAFTWPNYPSAVAANNLVNEGVVVVASTGNSGASGRYAVGAPGIGEKVIGVAAMDNLSATQLTFTVSPDNLVIGYNRAAAAPAAPLSGTAPFVRTLDTIAMPNIACDACSTTSATCTTSYAPPPGSLTGKIALIRRGNCSFYEKARNAQAAGAIGVVLYNNVIGQLAPTVAGTPSITIPVVAITQTDGDNLSTRIGGGAADMTWTANTISSPIATANTASSFSSWGSPPDLSFKPDIAAPGGAIWSTVPVEQGAYALQDGTSMAAPHVAGIVALLLEHRPKLTTADVRGLLQNYADPKGVYNMAGTLDASQRQGAGMVRIDRAINATTTINPAKLALGESQAGSAIQTLTITNASGSPVTYDVSHAPSVSTIGTTPQPAASTSGYATVQFSATSVTVNPNSSAMVDVTITADPALADRSLYGGYIVFTPQGGGNVLRVPYAGFKGDYQTIQVLLPTTNNYPWLARKTGATTYSNQTTGGTFTLQNGDIPYALAHFAHGASVVQIDVYNPTKTKYYGRAYYSTNSSRNSTSVANNVVSYATSAIAWNGNVRVGKAFVSVPNGNYVFEMKVLKALGDSADPAHWETWTSPVITIARPF